MSDEFELTTLDWIDQRRTELAHQLIELAEINSGSHNLDGLERMLLALRRLFEPLGGEIRVLDLVPMTRILDDGECRKVPLGRALSIRKRPEAPLRIFLGGHMDTVFPSDHTFQRVARLDDNRLHGPGVADLKGGLLVMRTALEALERSDWANRLGWEVLINPDEEIGSPGSAVLLEQSAARNHIGLVYEPSLPDGTLAGARKGSGNFSLVFHGRAAHAGREHHLGRNAVRALADFVRAVDDLNGARPGLTINPAFVHGGGPTNVVPDRAVLRMNIRVVKPGDRAWCEEQLRALVVELNGREGFHVEIHGGFTREPKPMTPEIRAVFALVADCGDLLGQPLVWQTTGGCCDGNNLAAAGLPNVDTLGVIGGNIHSVDEYMEIDSLVTRSKLSACLLTRLALGDIRWNANSERAGVP